MGRPELPPKQAVAVLFHHSPGRAEAQQRLREARSGLGKTALLGFIPQVLAFWLERQC